MVSNIQFVCKKTSDDPSLSGFKENVTYQGRSFNGLYHISEKWGSSKPTIMIERKVFEMYFEILVTPMQINLSEMMVQESATTTAVQLYKAS
jgi:hypothetical protein